MSWNYRVIRKKSDVVIDEPFYYEIHEVYYNKNGKPDSWTTDSIAPSGDSLEDLQQCLKLMLNDTKKPILEIVVNKKGNEKLVEVKDAY